MTESTEKPEKYRVVYETKKDYETWETQLNKLADLGYKVHTINEKFALMEIKNDYSNVTNLKDVPPNQVDEHLKKGWEIASTSISTKFVRMVKRE